MDRVGAGIAKAKARHAAASDHDALPGNTESRTGWSDLTAFDPDPGTMVQSRIVTFRRDDPARAPYDMLRTRLHLLMRQRGWTSVGITSPTNGCGKTTTSLNLAFSLAQLDLRVVLVDLDLRRPAVARQIGLSGPHSMAGVLQGTSRAADNFVRCGENLAIGSNAAPIRNSADVLHSNATAEGIAGLRSQLNPDIVIYDLPPMLVADDALAFARHLDCVLLIIAAELTRPDEVLACEKELAEHVAFVGVVVNKCWYAEGDYGFAEAVPLHDRAG